MQARFIMVAMVLLVAITLSRGLVDTRHLALEDRGDVSSRQVAIDAQVAGICLAFIISWTQRSAIAH